MRNRFAVVNLHDLWNNYTRSTPCFRKKIFTHIIGYKLRNSCLILIIFDNNSCNKFYKVV